MKILKKGRGVVEKRGGGRNEIHAPCVCGWSTLFSSYTKCASISNLKPCIRTRCCQRSYILGIFLSFFSPVQMFFFRIYFFWPSPPLKIACLLQKGKMTARIANITKIILVIFMQDRPSLLLFCFKMSLLIIILHLKLNHTYQ